MRLRILIAVTVILVMANLVSIGINLYRSGIRDGQIQVLMIVCARAGMALTTEPKVTCEAN